MRHLPRFALLAQTIIAAGTFIVANRTTQELTPLQTGWFRILLSFILLSPFYFLTMRRRRFPDRGDIWRLALLGLTGVTANQMLFLYGIQLSPPLNGALFYAFTPVVVLVIAAMLLGERLTTFKVGGVLAAVVGVILVLSSKGLILTAGPSRGDVFLLFAVTAWAGYTLLGKPLLAKYDALTVTVWAFGAGALSMLPTTPWVWMDFDVAAVSWEAWLSILYLSALTSGVAFTLWYWALKRLEAGQVAVFTNLQAPTTALISWLLFGAIPGALVVSGGLLVIIGVTLVQLATRRAKREAKHIQALERELKVEGEQASGGVDPAFLRRLDQRASERNALRLRRAIEELDEPYRGILRDVVDDEDDVPLAEIARRRGFKLSGIYTQFRRGLRQLREHLPAAADDEAPDP